MTLRTGPNAYSPPHFSYAKIYNSPNIEVLFHLRGSTRRLAEVINEPDARIIVAAMQEYIDRGGNWIFE